MSGKDLFTFLGLLLAIFICLVIIKYAPNTSFGNQTIAVGIIRSAGLSTTEKKQLNLSTINYQITDFNNSKAKIMGFYLNSTDKNLSNLVGKCVRASGTIPENWKAASLDKSYNRSVMDVTTLTELKTSDCTPYAKSSTPNTSEQVTYSGTLIHINRPAPDIFYDYAIKSTKGFSVNSQKTTQLDVVPSSNAIWIVLEKNIGKTVAVTGTVKTGYSESSYILIDSVK